MGYVMVEQLNISWWNSGAEMGQKWWNGGTSNGGMVEHLMVEQ